MKKVLACCLISLASLSAFPQTFSLSDTHFTKGSYYRTYRILFELAKPTLLEQSKPLLDSIAIFMNNNPTLQFEIGVNSDSRGSDISNTNITAARAKSIQQYLVGKQVSETRLKSVGYGESQLLIKDQEINGLKTIEEKEGQHQLNRRVEFKIIALN